MTDQQKISEYSIVELHNIEIYHNEEDEITIRRIGTSDYLSLDKSALNIYQSFNSINSINDIAILNRDNDYTVSDIIEFIEVLVGAGYVKCIDGITISESLSDQPKEVHKPNNLYLILFGKIGWSIYIISIFANLFMFYSFESIRPTGSDLFVSSSGIISIFIIILSTWIAIFFHEFGHVCAAKNLGIKAKIKWGYRLVFLVLETDVTDIWSVARKKRYGVYLAGLAWTSVLIFLCAALQLWVDNEFFIKILKFTVFLQLQTIVFQSLLFLRTDLFYVVTNFFKIDNLNEQALFIFKKIFTLKFLDVKKKINEMPSSEKRVVVTYCLFSLIGCFITLYLFILIDLPVAFYSVKQTLIKTINDPLFSFSYWDGIAMGTLTLCPIVILVIYSVIDLRKRIIDKRTKRINV